MATKYLKCTFLSNIVLLNSSQTEGRAEVLDFIPGSKFVGVTAGLIKNKKITQLGFDTLHDGTVRFSDATLLIDNDMSYKIPYSYFKPKVARSDDAGSKKVYNHHFIEEKEQNAYQFKQIRKGFITLDGKVSEPSYQFRQKFTKKAGKNKNDKEMYGYDAADKNQEWIFAISSKNKALLDELVCILTKEGTTYGIGKSTRVEYGKVKFEELEGYSENIVSFKSPNHIYLYVKSNLALFDPNTGQPTFEPTVENLGLKGTDAKIDWDKTQIRTCTIMPYNTAQGTKTYERIVIEKGSVIVLENVNMAEIGNCFEEPIGAFVNEGYGEILVNPAFLEEKNPTFTYLECSSHEITDIEDYVDSDAFIDCLVDNYKKELAQKELLKEVHTFTNDETNRKLFKNMNAQWGQIRSISRNTKHGEDAYAKVKTYIEDGIKSEVWKDKKDTLYKAIDKLDHADKADFLEQIAARFQLFSKQSQQGGEA